MNWPLRMRIAERFGSQIRFAVTVGTNEAVVSRVVRGWQRISSEKQAEWAKALECQTEDIFPNGSSDT